MRPKKSDVRRSMMAERIAAKGSCSAQELANEFNVSIMTVHRDLDELQYRGVVRKFHGGATAQPSSVFESRMTFRQDVEPLKKNVIARHALSFVHPGMSILLDDSTSALHMISGLAERAPLHVSTTFLAGLRRLAELQDVADMTVIAIGGRYDPMHDSFVGSQALAQISDMRWDALFMSAPAVDGRSIFHQEDRMVGVKKAMMEASKKKYLLVDNTKIGKVALHKVASLSEFDLVITDEDADPQILEQWETNGVSYFVANQALVKKPDRSQGPAGNDYECEV